MLSRNAWIYFVGIPSLFAASQLCLATDPTTPPASAINLSPLLLRLNSMQMLSGKKGAQDLLTPAPVGATDAPAVGGTKAPLPVKGQAGAPAATQPTKEDQAASIALALANLADQDVQYQKLMSVCYSNIALGRERIAKAQQNEDTAKVIGMSFGTAGIISTYHPVSAGLGAIGLLLTSGNKDVTSVFTSNVASATATYNAYQELIGPKVAEYQTEMQAAMTADGGALGITAAQKRIAALEKLGAACNMVGLAMAEVPKPVAGTAGGAGNAETGKAGDAVGMAAGVGKDTGVPNK